MKYEKNRAVGTSLAVGALACVYGVRQIVFEGLLVAASLLTLTINIKQ